jgi:hypothetical protein
VTRRLNVWFEVTVVCDKSVGRLRLVKTENPNACVTVNCKVCRIAIALYCLEFRVECIRCNKSSPSYKSRTNPYTWQYVYLRYKHWRIFCEVWICKCHSDVLYVPLPNLCKLQLIRKQELSCRCLQFLTRLSSLLDIQPCVILSLPP